MRMQLKSTRSIRSALSLATCALLSVDANAFPTYEEAKDAIKVAAKSIPDILEGSDFQASDMIYIEKDRIFVNEFEVSAKKEVADDEYFKGTFITDTMSGPSPNGLPAIKKPNESATYTSPSGTVKTPTDDKEQTFEFKDTRKGLSLEWQKPLSRLLKTINGISFSSEYDYMSMGMSSLWNKETEDRLTTFNTGVAYDFSILDPVGGAHEGLAVITDERTDDNKTLSEFDIMFGVTQLVTHKTVVQANYVANFKTGYLTDPYKLIVYLDNDDLAPVASDPYYYEERPSDRLSHIAYFHLIQDINDSVLKLSYRYFNDDWGISSNTAEARFLFNVREDTSVQFKYRYYSQQAADFYHYYLVDGATSGVDSRDVIASVSDLSYASADYRLGNLQSHALGFKISNYFMERDARIDFRVDGIISSDKKSRFETVRALVLQVAGKIRF